MSSNKSHELQEEVESTFQPLKALIYIKADIKNSEKSSITFKVDGTSHNSHIYLPKDEALEFLNWYINKTYSDFTDLKNEFVDAIYEHYEEEEKCLHLEKQL